MPNPSRGVAWIAVTELDSDNQRSIYIRLKEKFESSEIKDYSIKCSGCWSICSDYRTVHWFVMVLRKMEFVFCDECMKKVRKEKPFTGKNE